MSKNPRCIGKREHRAWIQEKTNTRLLGMLSGWRKSGSSNEEARQNGQSKRNSRKEFYGTTKNSAYCSKRPGSGKLRRILQESFRTGGKTSGREWDNLSLRRLRGSRAH